MSATLGTVRLPRAGTWEVDPVASTITFNTRHLFGLGKVTGSFPLASASLELGLAPERCSAHAVVNASGFTSGSAMRDKQVRSKKFLDADANPQITFTSTGVHVVDGEWAVDGVLTVRGISEPVRLTVREWTPGEDELGLLATTRVDRHAYGIRAARGMAGRRLEITLDLKARPQPR
jgi:polyisoprenoid-binding protein YceI